MKKQALALILGGLLLIGMIPANVAAMGFINSGMTPAPTTPASTTPAPTTPASTATATAAPQGALSASPAPSPSPTPEAPKRYGITNTVAVNIREKAAAKADLVMQVVSGTPLRILAEVSAAQGVSWYEVEFQAGDQIKQGFVRADLVDEILEPAYEALMAVIRAEAEAAQSIYVWITDSGKKYHDSRYCSGMKNPYAVTLAKAQGRGYGPCAVCDPPK